MITPENPSLVPVDDRGPRLERVLAHDDSELMLLPIRPNDPLSASAASIKKAAEWGIALGQQIHATESADRQAPTVLVVEDEKDVRELICEILQFEKYTVLDACDLDAALTVVESHAGPIDLLILEADALPPAQRLGPVLSKPFHRRGARPDGARGAQR